MSGHEFAYPTVVAIVRSRAAADEDADFLCAAASPNSFGRGDASSAGSRASGTSEPLGPVGGPEHQVDGGVS
jgi:hypothetical protein